MRDSGAQLHQRRQKSGQRLAGAGGGDQQRRAIVAGFCEQRQLMLARRPAAACEPALKDFGQQRRRKEVWFDDVHRDRLSRSCRAGRDIKKPAVPIALQALAATTTRPGTGVLSSLRADRFSSRDNESPAASIEAPHVAGAVGVAQAFAEDDAVAAMGFDGERQQAAGDQHAAAPHATAARDRPDRPSRRRRGSRSALASGLPRKPSTISATSRSRIEPGGARPLDHARRQVDAGEFIDLRWRTRWPPGPCRSRDRWRA